MADSQKVAGFDSFKEQPLFPWERYLFQGDCQSNKVMALFYECRGNKSHWRSHVEIKKDLFLKVKALA